MDLKFTPTKQLIDLNSLIVSELARRKIAKKELQKIKFLESMGKRVDLENMAFVSHAKKEGFGVLREHNLNTYPQDRVAFLKPIMKQDWGHLFQNGCNQRKYYIYAHCDPRKAVSFSFPKEYGGKIKSYPFYIGKGTGGRAWDMKRNQGHGIKIREILAHGYKKESIVKVLIDNLTENEAMEFESKFIYFFGTIYEQKRKGVLLNLDIPNRPEMPDKYMIEAKEFLVRFNSIDDFIEPSAPIVVSNKQFDGVAS